MSIQLEIFTWTHWTKPDYRVRVFITTIKTIPSHLVVVSVIDRGNKDTRKVNLPSVDTFIPVQSVFHQVL
jgi:hypothetical protein